MYHAQNRVLLYEQFNLTNFPGVLTLCRLRVQNEKRMCVVGLRRAHFQLMIYMKVCSTPT